MQHHHDHPAANVALPLRLAAEPYAKEGISSSCVSLGILVASVELAALADDDGIHAFCMSERLPRAALLERLQSAVPHTDIATTGWQTQPLLVLLRDTNSRDNNNNKTNPNLMQWHVYEENQEEVQPIAAKVVKDRIIQQQQRNHFPVHNAFVAELITNAIRQYYSQQILEPSVRGFLSVLEKQFARSDLYLFELLQNAVDDGATVVEFSLKQPPTNNSNQNATTASLQMTHNGRSFTPLDVLGLSSVGLSTKSRQGKRTIGFMGVGFKAVYKRYARVSIDDGTYRFVYQEPPNNTLGYGWVMLPLWQQQQQQESSEDKTGWCRFSLEQPRGGPANIRRDLLVLPRTAPPLLGRAALVKMVGPTTPGTIPPQQWILDWNGKHHTIERSRITSYASYAGSKHNSNNGSELITVTITSNKSKTGISSTKSNRWLFLTHKYKPSQAAAETYRNHTKRTHEGMEEVCGFIPLIGENHDVPHTLSPSSSSSSTAPSGWVHSVLPTKIRMPVPIHFQGSWLLSVDRQQVQDLTDNVWNGEILQQFPHIIATLFRWAAAQQLSSSSHYQAICQLLPSATTTATTNTATSSRDNRPGHTMIHILGQDVSLKALEQAFWSEPILPVGRNAKLEQEKLTSNGDNDAMDVDTVVTSSMVVPAISTFYYEGSNSIWVPPSWFEFLDADFLRGWLGKRPLRSDMLGNAAFHPLFASEHVLNQLNPLPTRINQLAAELGIRTGSQLQSDSVWKTIRLMAAIGSSYDGHPNSESMAPGNESDTHKKQTKPTNNGNGKNSQNQGGTQADVSTPSLPSSVTNWPVFVTETCSLARLDQVVLPSSDFSELPKDLQGLLRPYFIKDNSDVPLQQQQKFSGSKKDRRNKRQPRPIPLKQLHNLLESAICMIDRHTADPNIIPKPFETNQATWRKVSASASSFLKRAREELPGNTVEVATAASNLLQSYSTQRNLSEEEVMAVIQIGRFAFDTSNQLLLKYVLVDFPSSTLSSTGVSTSSTRLVHATAAYIGRSMDENGTGADLESFAGSKLHYMSPRYNSILESMSVTARRKAISLCALAGVQTGMSISITVASNVDKDKRLLEMILPKLDGKKLPSLRKNATKSDVILPYGLGVVMNKKRYYLLDSQIPVEWERLVATMPPTSAPGFISLLLSVPFESSTNITPSSVVAAANCLAGRTEPAEETNPPVETAKLLKDTACPLRQRLYFLPPGQAGAKALDMSESRLVEQLKSIRWLPCSVKNSPLTLLRPREALLEADPSRPEMPVVELPSSLLKRLKASQVALSLTWGVQAPPAPVGELVELAKEANRLLTVESEKIDREAIATAASRLFDVWDTVCRSHIRDGLSQSDKKALRTISALPCIPVRRVLDSGGSGNWIVLPKRCVRMTESLPESKSENDSLRHLTIASLVASDFICDFSHSTHNPFFHQPEVSNAVVQLAGIKTLADFQTSALVSVCGSFVRHCCAAKPVIPSRASPLRESFSFCLNWCLSSPSELPKKGQDIKLYVRHGPGIGAKALPARWVSLKGGPVQVVLNDSKARSALLSPEMNIQLLGVLDHTENEKDCPNAKLLSDIDAKVIKALGIMRLSDKRFLVKTRARGTASIVGSDAASKLQLVCALLKALELDRLNTFNNTNQASENDFLDRSYEPPLIIRHESLTREFQAPGMDTPSLIPLYAMFGRAPKLTKKRCILVSGDPDDYSMELEELVLDHVGVRANLSMAQMKPYRAATRLLLHLENDALFKKFVERDFADFEATLAWKKLAERRELLEQLEKATKMEDKQMLRELLIKGEELFDEDPDGGDLVLQNPRDILARLEEEAAVAEEAKLARERQEKEDAKSKVDQGLNPSTNILAVNPSDLEARGRGRGIDNRPAWMTNSGDDDNLSKTPITEEEVETKVDQTPLRAEDLPFQGMNPSVNNSLAVNASTPEARGRGRGVDNRPAWMTSSGSGPSGMIETPEAQQSLLSEPPVSATGDEALPTTEEAKSILSSILNSSIEGDIPTQNGFPDVLPPPVENTPALVAGIGRGRGRGLSNLPAWMTNPASQDRLTKGSGSLDDEVDAGVKRGQPSSPSNGEDGALMGSEVVTKKARVGSASLRLTLDVDLLPSEQPDFITWFKSTVDEEVERRGGKLSLSFNKL